MKLNKNSRRSFIKTSLAAGAALQFGGLSNLDIFAQQSKYKICLFSKVLQFLTVKEMAPVLVELGFDGVDLTVRPRNNVHVVPERVEEDLPKAVEILKKEGLNTIMISTGINDANDKHTEKILKTANALGIKNYRMGYYYYTDDRTIQSSLDEIKIKMKELADINRQYNITGSYQNHDSVYKYFFGSPILDLWECIRHLDPRYIGCQFDIRHAMVGGATDWKIKLRTIASHIQSFIIKDYTWGKVDGKWRAKNVPAGEGAVDFAAFSQMIKDLKIPGPISIHSEYPLGGAERGNLNPSMPKKEIFEYLRKDLKFARSLF
ncbi:MAG: TIM barrel protein [Melioribacteraceae bacterium]|nr:TIM barrel protein [Melioribacteraceae bacterium]